MTDGEYEYAREKNLWSHNLEIYSRYARYDEESVSSGKKN